MRNDELSAKEGRQTKLRSRVEQINQEVFHARAIEA